MGALAQKFGVSLDALIAANPGVSPNAMPVGAALLIPTDKNNPTGESTPTPVPFAITQIQCHPTLEDGMWCFLLAQNDLADALENISAQISLDPSRRRAGRHPRWRSRPCNVIPPRSSVPLTAFFPAPAPLEASPRVQILSGMIVPANDTRTLNASLLNPVTGIAPNGRSASVSGAGIPARGQPRLRRRSGWWRWRTMPQERVVGFRRWEGSGLQPGGSLPFTLTVASLGAPVVRVELFVEARP